MSSTSPVWLGPVLAGLLLVSAIAPVAAAGGEQGVAPVPTAGGPGDVPTSAAGGVAGASAPGSGGLSDGSAGTGTDPGGANRSTADGGADPTPVGGFATVPASGGPVRPSEVDPYVAPTSKTRMISTSGSVSTTTVSGWVEYTDTSGDRVGARQVVVQIRDREPLRARDPLIATARTNESGYYEAQVPIARFESKADGDKTMLVEVEALPENPAVRVQNNDLNEGLENGPQWVMERTQRVTSGTPETVDFFANSRPMNRTFQIANHTLTAYRFTEQEAGWTRKQVKARYPHGTNLSRYFFHMDKMAISPLHWDHKRTTIYHEYGHAVMSANLDYVGWKAPDSKFWFKNHCVWSDTGRQMAYYEGFAEFFEAAVNGDPQTSAMRLEGHAYYNETNDHPNFDCPESTSGDGYDGPKVEGAVANSLWDLYDPANEPHDDVDGDLGTILDVANETDAPNINNTPINNHVLDVDQFFVEYVEETGRHADARKIFQEYGIVKPDRFEHSPTANMCPVRNYPCSKLSAKRVSPLQPNVTVEAGLHSSVDSDTYAVTLTEEERLRVWAERTNGKSDIDVVVRDPSGQKVYGVNKVRPGLATHEFYAYTAGTYTISVFDQGTGTRAGSYELELNTTGPPPQTNEEDDTFGTATLLTPTKVSPHIDTVVERASTASRDLDWYKVTLANDERVLNASVTNDDDKLLLELQDDTGRFLENDSAGPINTTTELRGTYYLKVQGPSHRYGPGRIDGYRLNVTTQHISQAYEENDLRNAAANLDAQLSLDPNPATPGGRSRTNRGGTQWCSYNGGGSTHTAGGVGAGTAGGAGTGTGGGVGSASCPRHDWYDADVVTAGYEPHEADWYTVSAEGGERLNLTIPDDRLGVELYADGSRVADLAAGAGDRSVEYTMRSAGQIDIKITGQEYVASHRMKFILTDEYARDRLEDNDRQATATKLEPTLVSRATTSSARIAGHDYLRLASGDEDYFAVDTLAGETLNVTVTHKRSAGSVDVTLIRPDGTTTDATVTQLFGPRTHRVNVSAAQTGTYYVHVDSGVRAALKYNISVRTTGGIATDPGPVISDPTPVDPEPIDDGYYEPSGGALAGDTDG